MFHLKLKKRMVSRRLELRGVQVIWVMVRARDFGVLAYPLGPLGGGGKKNSRVARKIFRLLPLTQLNQGSIKDL